MPDSTQEVLGTLGEYFPPNIARAVLRSTLRRSGMGEERVPDDLADFVAALEQTLPMYIVDAGRRGECVGKVRRLLPFEPRSSRASGSTVRIRTAREVVEASDLAREVARKVGFPLLDQTKIATVASELARNVLLYVGDGELRVGVVDGPKRGIRIVAADSGPGIADVGLVMDATYRSRTGMGMGLKGARRLMDDLTIESRPGAGTTVVATKLVP
jgi:serine/threonine-protein kinase RsbT